jgi:hypothetical protein
MLPYFALFSVSVKFVIYKGLSAALSLSRLLEDKAMLATVRNITGAYNITEMLILVAYGVVSISFARHSAIVKRCPSQSFIRAYV